LAQLVFEKYEVIKRLAVGGMGEIFLARQVGVVDRLVILKALLPDLAEDEVAVQWFLDEARVAATLNHPNIVNIFEVGLWRGTYFIVMEFINGDTLARLIKASLVLKRQIPVRIAVKIVQDAALALDSAHNAHDLDGKPLALVHRDISPQNMMVRLDGVTKVLDFGIARAANRASRTKTGTIKGKLSYMPPEVLAAQPFGPSADQYALGVVFWELLVRKRLYKSDAGDIAMVRRILREPVPRPSTLRPDVPSTVDVIVEKMTAKDPARRFVRCADVATQLGEVLDEGTEIHAGNQVASFVKQLIGDKIAEQTRDVTPQSEDFRISLSRDQATPTSGSWSSFSWTGSSRPRRSGMLAAGLAILLVIAAATWWLTREDGDHTVLTAEASTVVDAGAIPSRLPDVSPPRLTLNSTPAGAAVRLGERALGTTPFTTEPLPAGVPHALDVSLDGFAPMQVAVTLEAGEQRELHVQLTALKTRSPRPRNRVNQPPPTPPQPAKIAGDGYLTLNTQPWTAVSIDGAPHGPTPLFRVKLAPGPHQLRLVNEGAGIDVSRKIEMDSEKTKKVEWDLRTK